MTVSGHRVEQAARRTAEDLPGVSHGYPFTEGLDVYKVAGKVFLIVTEDPAERIVTVKVDPDHGRALQRSHESVGPGRYLDKRHWLSIAAGPGVTTDLVENLVAGSYALVVERVPRRDRPDDAREAIDRHISD
ncbi:MULTISPECIES: MmcQ/YjbR family DNA-binding protein [Rhodococcus]|uniref:MmcQ/YjbR family DNA-binding protein n=1 Tax=Rhodococcus jostii TaxID=132919 RepID=A0ABU4CE86_RHOJO|nr:MULTISPECIES: MmcQ/YjbR family DNA-binding protein [Rhodococcus]MDI9948063.1 MmcQ/YjbR family DNA-binding protein [Rhodococcus sp. IEGM 1305]MDV6281804.1 MmcQ/YjbR family DNA-binding protein [Rhodococcus jostii]